MRGFLAGLVMGLVVSGLVLGAASVLVDLSERAALRDAAPAADAVEVPPGSGFDAVREDRAAALPGTGSTRTPRTAPRVPAPAPDDTGGLSAPDTAPVAAPAIGGAAALAPLPEEGQGAGDVAVEGLRPALPRPRALAPGRAEADARLLVSPDADQPPGNGPPGTGPPGTDRGARDLDPARPSRSDAAGAAPADAPRRIVPEGSARMSDRSDGARTDTLSRLAETAPDDDGPAQPASVPAGALARNAVAAEVPPGKPLMSIVLVDDGKADLGPEALAAFAFPHSIAIPATRADAAAAAARHRAAGVEVLLAVDLPEAARPADVETAMATWLAAVPQAAAVIEGAGTGLQTRRDASAQLAPILLESGHGLVMRPNGLDTAQTLLSRAGVPAATLLREIDAEGQDAAEMRRALDKAALRAGQQEDGVIVLGRLRAETIRALRLWERQDRAESVALVPVSAVLRQAAAGQGAD